MRQYFSTTRCTTARTERRLQDIASDWSVGGGDLHAGGGADARSSGGRGLCTGHVRAPVSRAHRRVARDTAPARRITHRRLPHSQAGTDALTFHSARPIWERSIVMTVSVCLFGTWFVLSFFICIFLYCFVCQYQSSDWLWRPPPKWHILCRVGR